MSANYIAYTFHMQKMASMAKPLAKAPLDTHSAAWFVPPSTTYCTTKKNNTPLQQPLATYYKHGHCCGILAWGITHALHMATTIVSPSVGFQPSNVSAQSF